MTKIPTRVLIVDDDTTLLTALTGALALRMPEIDVETCQSGQAALEMVTKTEYDAVISDIKMPGMDGLTLLTKIRSIQPELPTLLITGHGQHDLAVQALRGGAFDFIQKPVERDYFVASLARAIRVRKLDRQIQQQQRELTNHADRLELAVESRTEQLRELNRRKDAFVATLSHELRNPLACILTAAEFLLLSEDEESQSTGENCRIIMQQAGHMRRLLDDLLDLSRINCDKIILRKTRVSLQGIIDTSVVSTLPLMRERRHELHIRVAPAVEDCMLNVDATRVEQVVVNLLNNAAKYSDPGCQVELIVDQEGTDIVIAVKDEGIGIPNHVLSRVFEPFVQAEDSGQRTEGGLGIGLALVRQLVALHGGSVTASSEGEGKGSCFTVRLPIGAESEAEAEPEPAAVAAEPSTQRPPSRRVLVVEDQRALAWQIQRLLEKHGQEVVGVHSDGPSAIDAALTHLPDLIFLDIGLPGMSGYEVAQRIRECPELDRTMLVAVTGYGTTEDRSRAFESGFDFHLVKPCSLQSLAECLQQSTQSRQHARTPPG